MELTTAEKHIKRAWIAGVASGIITFVLLLLSLSLDDFLPQLGLDLWSLLDVMLIFGLTYGIYRKSRTCAILLLVYFLISKIFIAVQMGRIPSLFIALIFVYLFVQGVRGTFAFQARQPKTEKIGIRSTKKKVW